MFKHFVLGSCGRAVHESFAALKNRIQNTAVSREHNGNAYSPAEEGSKGCKSALLHVR
jgi:hypothetical protein